MGIEPRAETRADETGGRAAVVVLRAFDREFFRKSHEPGFGRRYPNTDAIVIDDGCHGRHELGSGD